MTDRPYTLAAAPVARLPIPGREAFFDRNVIQELPIGIAECRRASKHYRHVCDEVVALHDPGNAARFPTEPGRDSRSHLKMRGAPAS